MNLINSLHLPSLIYTEFHPWVRGYNFKFFKYFINVSVEDIELPSKEYTNFHPSLPPSN